MYEVIRPLAAGHQGQVDLARAPDGRLVALKRVALEGTAEERAVARRRLRREVELLRDARVDGVVPLLDVVTEPGDDGEDDVVLVMPYLSGGSLHDRIQADGPFAPEHLGALAVPLLRALAGLHRRGILHRDIKPGNVLFDEHDHPHLVDFGIGTARDLTAGLSPASTLIGTPAFIAPERARGEAATPASDIYALGATLRYALSGMPPHGVGDIVTVVGRAAAGLVEPLPPHVEPHVAGVLDRMCAVDPDARPTAAELLPGPQGTAVGPTAAPAAPFTAPAPSAAPRRRRLAGAIGAAALLLTGVVVGVLAADRLGDDGRAEAGTPLADLVDSVQAPPTTACTPLPYQGCDDDEPAPGTDGEACLEGRFDHDEEPTNGCEAVADDIDDVEMASARLEGTIIPVGDGDKILVPVRDRWQLLCDARLTLSLTAPDGLDLELRVFDSGDEIGKVEVAGGATEHLSLGEPSCAHNDSTTLEVIVRGIAGRTSEPWTLERSGSW